MDFGRGSCSREWFNKEEKMTPLSNFPWEPPVASVEDDSTLRANANMVKEHMFEKVVTPSDVGKLNRLVIPKQHAEKYFPLDSSTNEKGLVLNFEDRNGKPWRFRYSYWNSSQSYVMTKGWSRFVKDKKLEAGDVVAFLRGVGELGKERHFIDWRRRPDGSDRASLNPHTHHHFPWSPFSMQPSQLKLNPLSRNSFSNIVVNPGVKMGGSVLFFRSVAAPQMGTGTTEWQQQVVEQPIVFDSVPVAQGKGAAKKLRLFGVNMECPISELSTTTVGNARMASQTPHLSSSSQQHPLQLRLYNGISPVGFLNANKGKSSLSLDFDI